MSKIVQAVNAMISNPKLIADVMEADNEYFFLYKGKYKWSIKSLDDGNIGLWFYPGNESLQDLMHVALSPNWQSVPMVSYLTQDIGTKEATASFKDLYNLVKEKLYSVDTALDDIISDLENDLPF